MCILAFKRTALTLSFRILALFLVGKGDFCSSDYLIVVCLFVCFSSRSILSKSKLNPLAKEFKFTPKPQVCYSFNVFDFSTCIIIYKKKSIIIF